MAQSIVCRFHTAVLSLTASAACGSGPSSPIQQSPVEPPPVQAAQVPVDAALPDAPPPPKLECDEGTAIVPAPAPESTWFCARPDGTRHGPFVTLFPGGTIEVSGTYKDNLLDGRWERVHPDGTVIETGSYVAGHKHGAWRQTSAAGALLGEYEMIAGSGVERRWLDDGTLYSEISYKAGVRHGPMKIYGRDRTVVESGRYVDGKLDGPHVVGSIKDLRIEEEYKRGVLVGERKIWELDILIAEERYDKRGRRDGPYTLWRNRRTPRVKGQFDKGKRVGTWVWNDRGNHKEREGTYVDGKKDGIWTEWSEDRLVFSGNYVEGKPDGEFMYFDRNGDVIARYNLFDGTGVLQAFHPNGKPSMKQRLVRGLANGIYQELSAGAGRVTVEGRFRAGHKDGTWKEWTADGVLLYEQTWKGGKLDGSVKKYVDGKLSLEASYVAGAADGPYTEYRDGRPAVSGRFAADRKTGTWTHYDREGSVVLQVTYKDGLPNGAWRQLVGGVVLEGAMNAGRRVGIWKQTDKAGVVRQLTYTTP